MFLKSASFVVLAAIAMLAANAQCAEKTVRVLTGFQHPESVSIVGDRRFVSNIGEWLDPFAHAGFRA